MSPFSGPVTAGSPLDGMQESICWYNALDPFLQQKSTDRRSGTSQWREYKVWKQCPVYETFDGVELDSKKGIQI